MFLRPTSATIIAVVGAKCTLAGNTIVTWETIAGSTGAIARSLVRAFNPWMQIICINYIANPSVILWTSTLGAVRTCPFRFPVKSGETFTIIIGFTGTMTGTIVLAKTTLTMPSFIPRDLAP